MHRSAGKSRGLTLAFIVGLGIASLAAPRPAAAQDCTEIAPYVFILFDTSGSMSWGPPCSQAELDAGFCAARCDSFDCWVPQQGDDPGSKFYQAKQALHEVISNTTGVQLGFATYNQDALFARSKHWLYEAAGPGITIPGWGAFPAAGSRETFGTLWNCDTGSGDNKIGCAWATPADLIDGWELGRMRALPKLGKAFNEPVTFYVRQSGIIYRVRYTAFGAIPGNPVTVTEAVWRCLNSGCTSVTSLGQVNIPFTPVGEMLTWDNGISTLNRTNPELSYFSSVAMDAGAQNTCAGWEPNTDSAADPSSGYNLRWPTTTDPRGAYFSSGDMIPEDWQTSHRDDILARLAPNLLTNPTAAPDFRASPYLQDQPILGQSYLRLKNQAVRPLIASGSTPHGNALNSFRTWWTGCSNYFCVNGGWSYVAQLQDPYWICRRQAGNLLGYGIKTYVVGFGVTDPGPTKLACMAANGGTTWPYTPRTRKDLVDTLTTIFADIKAGN
jgi:hypothetical protein